MFSKILASFTRLNGVLLFIGIILFVITGGDFFHTLKPAKDFEYLMENGAEKGMRIKGDVLYSYEYYAIEETWKENRNGSRTASKTSHYYYAIPIGPADTIISTADTVIGLEVPTDDYKSMQALMSETINYLTYATDERPSTKVSVDGWISVMDKNMEKLMREYLLTLGYTEDEIDEVDTFYYIEQPYSVARIRVMFLAGLGFFVAGCVLFFLRFKKISRLEAEGTQVE